MRGKNETWNIARRTYLPGPRPQQLEARKLFVCGLRAGVRPAIEEADLRSYACDRAGVDALVGEDRRGRSPIE